MPANLGLVLGDYQPDDPDDDDDYDLDFEGVYATYAELDSDNMFRLLAAPNDFYSVRRVGRSKCCCYLVPSR